MDDAGKFPKWNETIAVSVSGEEEVLKITCFDEDLILDAHVGEADFKVKELLTDKPIWIKLEFKDDLAAEILIKGKLITTGDEASEVINSFLEEEKRLSNANEQGTLYIKVLQGRLTRDTEALVSMDPYITIEY